ncbi:MAG: hypothetical protein IID46_03550 [Planctomycetes bacterium]|nr:hypothetical protein [Planctomycetota bacterium]
MNLDIRSVEIGLDGRFKVGKWTLAGVNVHTSGPCSVQMIVEVSDPDGSATSFPTEKVNLSETGLHELQVLFKSGRLSSPLRITLRDGTRDLAQWQSRLSNDIEAKFLPAFSQSIFLVATLGKPAGLTPQENSSSEIPAPDENNAIQDNVLQVVEFETASQLPVQFTAYDSLDALVISDHYDLEEQRNRAVRDWVWGGGHLILSAGSDVDSYKQSSLYEWVGELIPLEGPTRLREVSRLELFVVSKTRLERGFFQAAKIRIEDKTFDDPLQGESVRPGFSGRVFVSGLEGPLLVQVPFGFGRITFFGLDLHRPPLSTWKSTSNIVRKLLFGERQGTTSQTLSTGRQLTSSGITDLASQLHASQDHFPTIHRFTLWKVLGLVLIYLVLIGPVDYFLVHRILKRPQWTWLTFPLIVVISVLLAVQSAQVLNQNVLRANQLDMVDIDVASQSIRIQSWMTLYSPETRRYRVTVQPRNILSKENVSADPSRTSLSDTTPRLSWSGIPESTFEGMYRPSGFEIGRPDYHLSPGATEIVDLPIPIWSTKSLEGSWIRKTGPLVESQLTSSGTRQLSGTIVHHLKAPLDDWILAFGNRVIRSRENGPYARWKSERPLDLSNKSQIISRKLSEFLTNTTAKEVFQKSGEIADILFRQKDYDLLERDPYYIMRMLTFHEVAGGKLYTGLDNNSLRKNDLSPLLALNRAILFAKMEAVAADYTITSGEPEPELKRSNTFSYVRIVLPVKMIQTEQKLLQRRE